MEVSGLMGYRRGRGFAVPGRLCLSACASSASSLQASLVDASSFAHFNERLGSDVKGPWVVTTVNKDKKLPSD